MCVGSSQFLPVIGWVFQYDSQENTHGPRGRAAACADTDHLPPENPLLPAVRSHLTPTGMVISRFYIYLRV